MVLRERLAHCGPHITRVARRTDERQGRHRQHQMAQAVGGIVDSGSCDAARRKPAEPGGENEDQDQREPKGRQ